MEEQGRQAVTLDHVITWKVLTSSPPVSRRTDSPGQDTVGCAGMKYDQLRATPHLPGQVHPSRAPTLSAGRSEAEGEGVRPRVIFLTTGRMAADCPQVDGIYVTRRRTSDGPGNF
jgi:hypothetical protein